MRSYGPSVRITRLFERRSKLGNPYFVGRCGAARIAILNSGEVAADGTPIWDVVVSQAVNLTTALAQTGGDLIPLGTYITTAQPGNDQADAPIPFDR